MITYTDLQLLLTDEEKARVDKYLPPETSHYLTNAMVIWEWFLEQPSDTSDRCQYHENVGVCELRDNMANFAAVVDLAFHLIPDNMYQEAFDFEFVPRFMETYVTWDTVKGPALHPKWLDCLRRSYSGEEFAWVHPDEPFDVQQAQREGWAFSNGSDGSMEIHRLDDAEVFTGDDAVAIHILNLARSNSDYHLQALKLVKAEGGPEWSRLFYIAQGMGIPDLSLMMVGK